MQTPRRPDAGIFPLTIIMAYIPESTFLRSQHDSAPSALSVKVNPVASELNNLEHELGALRDRLATLEDRLLPVLTPQHVGEANGDKTLPVPSRSPLAHTLDGYAARLRHMDALVSDILQRLEV